MPSAKTLALAAGYAALAATDSALAGSTAPRARRLRGLVKPLLMPVLHAAFRDAVRTAPSPGRLPHATAAAQGLSWAGDVALLGSGDRAFLAGLGSFGAAHAAYITGFSTRPPTRTGLRTAAAVWAAATPAMTLAARRRSPGLAVPVAGYATVLAAMFAAASGHGRTLRAGTGLFLLSDTLLGVGEFVLRERRPALEAAVMATYTGGQGLIALGVARELLSGPGPRSSDRPAGRHRAGR